MRFLFAGHSLDPERRELRRGGAVVPVEPQVFDLILFLAENADRVVSKDDLLAAVWDGRIVSESTLTSRINAARRAVGDTGEEQGVIRTVPRRGYRLVATVCRATEPEAGPDGAAALQAQAASPAGGEKRHELGAPDPGEKPGVRRGSVAVMPFVDASAGPIIRGGLADALTHDVITRLAKLRSLFVIAQGSVFALHERGVGASEAGRILKVDYVAGGTLRRSGANLAVSVELMDARTDRIVWADTFEGTPDQTLRILDRIGGQIVNAIANEVEMLERNRAMLRPPTSLDSWEAYHRGLWHAYRFDRRSNERARGFFELAVHLDPTFSRAHAGLSFAHWQTAFQGWGDRDLEIERAYAAAAQGLMADDRDPAAHWAMGRALWLRRSPNQALDELQRAVDLSPSFALGHYTIAFVQAQAGDTKAAIEASDRSRELSPFDPMLFAMLATRALALARLGRFDEAADWAEKAAARPNAHEHILALAAYCFLLAGREEAAGGMFAVLRSRCPSYDVADFTRAFHLAPAAEELFQAVAARASRLR